MPYILQKYVFAGDEEKMWEFIGKVAKASDNASSPPLFETFSYPLLEKYKETKSYAVLQFFRDLLEGEEKRYYELFLGYFGCV